MGHPPQIQRDHNGRPIYDLSNDQVLADNGDEAAERRLATKRRIVLEQIRRENSDSD
jgi:hypothetical protein